jgi:hypothetical protein
MFPPLWPWKVIMLPARGPRPTLKGETALTLRLMDDIDIPQVAQTYGPGWHFFGEPHNESFNGAPVSDVRPQLAVRQLAPAGGPASAQASYADYVTRNVALPAGVASAPGMPVFVLNNGAVLAVSGYGYSDSRISYTLAAGGSGVISTNDVDWSTTTRLNARRGVRVTLRGGHIVTDASGL